MLVLQLLLDKVCSGVDAVSMSGLHNRFPRHFYKRGNLFNTYLSHTDSSPSPSMSSGRVEQPSGGSHAQPQSAAASRHDLVDTLISFLQRNVSIPDANRFLRAVSQRHGVAEPSKKDPWAAIRSLATVHLSDDEVRRYLTELERRKRVGQPLVRSSRR